jgi:hypothetical protein
MFVKKDYLIIVILLLSIVPIFLLPFFNMTGMVVFEGSEGMNLSITNIREDLGFEGVKFMANLTNATSTTTCSSLNSNCSIITATYFDTENNDFFFNGTCSFYFPGEYAYNISCKKGDVYVSGSPTVQIIDPNVSFIENKSFTGTTFSSLVWGDVNDDNNWDLVYGGKNDTPDQSLNRCLNDEGSLESCDILNYGFDNGAISLGDVNLDGKLDMLISGRKDTTLTNKYLSIIYNNNTEYVVNSTGLSGSSVLFDYDDDGRLDIIASDSTGVYFYKNTIVDGSTFFVLDGRYNDKSASWCKGMLNPFRQGGDNFLLTCGEVINLTDGETIKNFGINYSKAHGVVFDSNNNNKIDLIICGDNQECKFLTFTDNFGFQENTSIGTFPKILLTFGDINNNGFVDLVYTSLTENGYFVNDGVDLYKNIFLNEINELNEGSISLFDYNNNGRLDLAISGNQLFKSNILKIFNNNFTARTNTKPYPPSENFTSYYQDGKLHLGWGKGWDNVSGKNFTDGLYYNLEVRDANNEIVLSGKFGGTSNPTQGYLGNMFQQRNYSLNVTEANYKWKVQTIDAGLKSSNWSDWQIYDPCKDIPEEGIWNILAECIYPDETINLDINITQDGKLIVTNKNIANNITIAGQLILRNSTLTGLKTFEDNGNLTKEWYISINTLNENQESLQGVTLSIINNNSNSYQNNNFAIQYFENSSGMFDYSNYTIIASKDRYENNQTNFILDNNKIINLTLRDFVYPIYSNFNNEETTNFSDKTEEELTNLPDVKIGNSHGQIKFNENVNVKSVDINNIVTIGSESISVSQSNFSNKSAELVFKNLIYESTPVVLRNGEICGSRYCSQINYNAGILRVNVTGFSTYTLMGNAEINLSLSTDFHNKSIPGIPIKFDINYYNTSNLITIDDANCNLTLADGSYYTNNSVSITFENVGDYSYFVNCSKSGSDTIIRSYNLKIYPNTTVFIEEWSGEGVWEAANLVIYENDLFFYSNEKGFDKLFIYNNSQFIYEGVGLFHGSMIILDINKNQKKDVLITGLSTKTETKLIKKK